MKNEARREIEKQRKTKGECEKEKQKMIQRKGRKKNVIRKRK